MSRVPHFFTRVVENPELKTSFYKFEFDDEHELFIINGKKITVEAFDAFELSYDIPEHPINNEDLISSPLFITPLSRLIGTPALHNWLIDNRNRAVEAVSIMRSVYKTQLGRPLDLDPSLDGFGHMSFDARIREEGDVNLQVLGDCACLGINLYGLYVHDGFQAGFAEYELHNTDFPAQYNSLYAGIGHLARLASGRPNDQLSIFD